MEFNYSSSYFQKILAYSNLTTKYWFSDHNGIQAALLLTWDRRDLQQVTEQLNGWTPQWDDSNYFCPVQFYPTGIGKGWADNW